MELEKIFAKMKDCKNIKNDKEIAGLLSISPSDLNNRKKRKADSLIALIVNWAIQEGISLDWLLKDEIKKKDKPIEEEHEELIIAYDAASEDARNFALKGLQDSAEKSRSTGLKGSDCAKLNSA